MSNLILNSLEIHNFRAFRSLRIEKLGRVNLIVGKNNVGKTCLLEALLLYANPGDLHRVRQLLSRRDEIGKTLSLSRILGEKIDIEELLAKDNALVSSIKNLFYGRGYVAVDPIQIGVVDSPDTTIELTELGLEWQANGTKETYSLEGISRKMTSIPSRYNLKVVFENGLSSEDMASFWNNIKLTSLQNEIIPSLQLIDRRVEQIDFIKKNGEDEIPHIRFKEQDYPVPLRSLGGGMMRLVGLALALVNAKNGLLLIDEIDTGLHYSVQKDIWQFILKMANKLNVQVFATTHSWDCIESFQQVVQEYPESENLLISLREVKGKAGEVIGLLADKEKLERLIQGDIEVR